MKEIDRAAVDRKTVRFFRRAALLMLAVVALLALAAWLSDARAETGKPDAPPGGACARCGPREAVETCLREQWGEHRNGAGQDVRGPIVFLFLNRETGTWTIVTTMDPSGRFACVLAGGAGWRLDVGL